MNRMSEGTGDEPIFISDNIEAIKILTEKGLLNLLKPRGTANSAFHCYEEKDHWCMASNHIGHELEKDNGYAIIKVPKTAMDKEEAGSLFANCIRDTTEGEISYGFERIAPLKNN